MDEAYLSLAFVDWSIGPYVSRKQRQDEPDTPLVKAWYVSRWGDERWLTWPDDAEGNAHAEDWLLTEASRLIRDHL